MSADTRYPRGVQYPAINLALDKIISVSHPEDLDPTLFPGKTHRGVGNQTLKHKSADTREGMQFASGYTSPERKFHFRLS